MNVAIWLIVGFQQRNRQDSENLRNDAFFTPVTSAQCIIETEKCPDLAILLIYYDDDFSQVYGQSKKTFRALTKDDILNPYISVQDFRSSNEDVDNRHNLLVFGIRYHKNLESAQPTKLEFNFFESIPPGIYGYALVLTNNLVSIGSDGQRHFGLF